MIEIIKPDKTMARVLGPGKLLAGTVYVPGITAYIRKDLSW